MGGLRIDDTGIIAAANLTLMGGATSGSHFHFDAAFQFEANTTGHELMFPGTSIDVPAGHFFQVHASGDLFLDAFVVHGTFDFKEDSGVTTIAVAGSTTLGALGSLAVDGTLGIVASGPSWGFYGLVQLGLATPTLPDFSLSAHFQFAINTTDATQTALGFVVDPSSHEIEADGAGRVRTDLPIAIPRGSIMVEAGGHLRVAA